MIYIESDTKLDYSDVMLVPRTSGGGPESRSEINLYNDDNVIPIIAANMDGVGTFEMAETLSEVRVMTALHKHYSAADLIRFFNGDKTVAHHAIYSMGANDADLEKFRKVFGGVLNSMTVCVDVANGYTDKTAEFIHNLKKKYSPGIKIIAGNVVTEDGVRHLVEAGADIIKIGIGPGSVCTTRKLTGIGYPQLSAVAECADYAHNTFAKRNIKIIADGGITCPGDVAKALAAGADYVMVGGVFAGHVEGGGELCDLHGNTGRGATGYSSYVHLTHRKFYGMASKSAQDKHNGGVADYRASEGKEVIIPDRGSIENTIKEYLGGLRSTCCYLGTYNLDDISVVAKFIRVSRQLNNVFGA